jgi:hypothetical protein
MTDPCKALQQIREKWPKIRNDSQRLFRVFQAVVIDDRELHNAIIAQSFVRALEQLNGTGAPPKP